MKKLQRLSHIKVDLSESAPAEPQKVNESVNNGVEFWVVTATTPESTLQDICYKTNPLSFAREMQGGLKESMVFGLFPADKEAEATKMAEGLLKKKATAKSRHDY